MRSFDWKKNIEDSIKDGLIITITTIGIFYVLKAANIKPPKTSLDAVDIILCSLQKMDQRVIQQTIYGLLKVNKLHNALYDNPHQLSVPMGSCFYVIPHLFHTYCVLMAYKI